MGRVEGVRHTKRMSYLVRNHSLVIHDADAPNLGRVGHPHASEARRSSWPGNLVFLHDDPEADLPPRRSTPEPGTLVEVKSNIRIARATLLPPRTNRSGRVLLTRAFAA